MAGILFSFQHIIKDLKYLSKQLSNADFTSFIVKMCPKGL